MSDKLSAKLRMYKLLLATMKTFEASWKTHPAFARAVAVLEAEVIAINALNAEVQKNNSGVTEDKGTAKLHMIEEAVKIAGALLALADSIESKELFASADFEKTDFVKAKETDVDDMALIVYHLAEKHLAQLADYGITQEDLDHLAQYIENFSERIGQPKVLLNSTKQARNTQSAHFDNADRAIKNQLKKLILQFKTKDKAFYEAFENASTVTNLSPRTTEKAETLA